MSKQGNNGSNERVRPRLNGFIVVTVKQSALEPQANPTSMDRLDSAFRAVLTVPKDALLKEEARMKAAKRKKREKKPS